MYLHTYVSLLLVTYGKLASYFVVGIRQFIFYFISGDDISFEAEVEEEKGHERFDDTLPDSDSGNNLLLH